MTTDSFAALDSAAYLDSEEIIAEYLSLAMEDENPDALLLALSAVARARGMMRALNIRLAARPK